MPSVLSDSLLGADITTVGARLGPPLDCREVGEELHLAYLAADGRHVPDGIVLVDGVVVRERPGLHSLPMLQGYWIGQPIERMLPTLGAVQSMTRHLVMDELQFAAFRVCVHEGRIVLAQPRPLTRAS